MQKVISLLSENSGQKKNNAQRKKSLFGWKNENDLIYLRPHSLYYKIRDQSPNSMVNISLTNDKSFKKIKNPLQEFKFKKTSKCLLNKNRVQPKINLYRNVNSIS